LASLIFRSGWAIWVAIWTWKPRPAREPRLPSWSRWRRYLKVPKLPGKNELRQQPGRSSWPPDHEPGQEDNAVLRQEPRARADGHRKPIVPKLSNGQSKGFLLPVSPVRVRAGAPENLRVTGVKSHDVTPFFFSLHILGTNAEILNKSGRLGPPR
jgi:hypothetical protein